MGYDTVPADEPMPKDGHYIHKDQVDARLAAKDAEVIELKARIIELSEALAVCTTLREAENRINAALIARGRKHGIFEKDGGKA